MDLYEPRLVNRGLEHVRRGIEPLDVPDLQHRLAGVGQSDQVVRLFERARHGLLHQDVPACLEGLAGQAVMIHGRHRHRHRAHLAQERLHGRERPAAVPLRDLAGPRGVRVVDPDQSDAREVRVDAGVMLAQRSDTDDADADEVVHRPPTLSLPT